MTPQAESLDQDHGFARIDRRITSQFRRFGARRATVTVVALPSATQALLPQRVHEDSFYPAWASNMRYLQPPYDFRYRERVGATEAASEADHSEKHGADRWPTFWRPATAWADLNAAYGRLPGRDVLFSDCGTQWPRHSWPEKGRTRQPEPGLCGTSPSSTSFRDTAKRQVTALSRPGWNK
jgi:hypothetical protein